jgi:hypothetical protein
VRNNKSIATLKLGNVDSPMITELVLSRLDANANICVTAVSCVEHEERDIPLH